MNVMRRIEHRTFIISEKGYMGLGQLGPPRGGHLCIIYGYLVPVLLRKEGDEYVFVGYAYTHGLMDEQALELLSSGRVKRRL